MKNMKTTGAGIVAALPQLLIIFGVPIPPGVAQAISDVGLFLLGLFARDYNSPGR